MSQIFQKGIQKAALLGLNSKPLDLQIFHKNVQENLDLTKEKESIFLDALCLTKSFFEAGSKLINIEKTGHLIPICPEEDKKYCSPAISKFMTNIFKHEQKVIDAFLPLVIEKINKNNQILPPSHIKNIFTLIQDKPKFRKLKPALIQSIGNRGKWIFEIGKGSQFSNVKTLDLLDMRTQERKNHLANLITENNQEGILSFLDELFEAESNAVKKNYIKQIGRNLFQPDQSIFQYFNSFFNEEKKETKALKQLLNTYFLFQLSNNHENLTHSIFNQFFVNIWQKKGFLSNGFTLKKKPEIEKVFEEFNELDIAQYFTESKGLEPIDQFIFLILAVTPIDYWETAFKTSRKALVKSIYQLQTIEDSSDFNFLQALVIQSKKSQDFELVNEIFILTSFKYLDADFLKLLPTESIFNYIETHIKHFTKNKIKLIELIIETLGIRKKWSSKFSKLIFLNLTNDQIYPWTQMAKPLWTAAPYFDESLAFIYNKNLNDFKTHTSQSFQENLEEIIKIKQEFTKLNLI